MALKTRQRRARIERYATFRAIAAGWTTAHLCKTGGPNCVHVRCERCRAETVVEPRGGLPGDVYPSHVCDRCQLCWVNQRVPWRETCDVCQVDLLFGGGR